MKTKNTKAVKKVQSQKPAPAPKSKVGSPPKSRGKYDGIRQDLLRQRRALLTEVGTPLTSRHDETTSPDLTDQAQAEVDRNFILRLKEREQKLLKKIDEAIERIDNGGFGICRGCGNEIPLPRLEARPVTDLCIACKTRQEQDERIRG